MSTGTALAAGALFGLMGCAAPALLFERALKEGAKVSVAAGLASIAASFVLLMAALVAVRVFAAEALLEFGCAMVAAFLLFWAVEAIRAWRVANGVPAGKGEGTEREQSS